jgi:predicted acyltransferase (DUF342 family)
MRDAKKFIFILLLPLVAYAQENSLAILPSPLNNLVIYSNAAITMGASSIVSGNMTALAAVTMGASTQVAGDLTAGAAATLGASTVLMATKVDGNLTAGAAVTLGADATVSGNIKAGAAATLGATTILSNIMVGGDLIARAAIGIGAGSSVGGDLTSGAAVIVGANGKIGGNALGETALSLGAEVVIDGNAQAGIGDLTLGANSLVTGDATAGAALIILSGATVLGTSTFGSIVNLPLPPIPIVESQQSQVLAHQAQLTAMTTPPANILPASITTNRTLRAGVYNATAIVTTAAVVITLDGEGVDGDWIINSNSHIVFGAASIIELINVTDNSTITWNAVSYIQAGASSDLIGTFFSYSYILTGENTSVNGIGDGCGGLYTATGAVTLGASNTIGAIGCSVSVPPIVPDHFAISYGSQGIHCIAETVSVTALNLDNTITNGYIGTIILETQLPSSTGTWALVTGAGAFNDAIDNDGKATYAFAAADNGVAIFSLYYSEGTATFNIDAYDDTIRDDDLESNITFSASGFTVTETTLSNPTPNPINQLIGTKTAGSLFNLHIAAYGTTATDPICGIIETYTGSKNLTLTTNHINPSNGSVLATAGGAIVFTNGQAVVSTQYKDVGKIQITISDSDSDSDTSISGSSGDFVVKPASFDIALSGTNQHAADHNGSVYIAAGNDFTITITAKDSEGDPTPNFGNENVPVIPTLTHSLYLPNSGVEGVLNGDLSQNTNPAEFTGSFNWSEVGIMHLSTSITDYLNAVNSDVSSTLNNVGRFIPASFEITTTNGTLDNTCLAGQGSFSYIGQPFGYLITPTFTVTAKNALTTQSITINYQGDFNKLDNTSITSNTVIADTSNKLSIFHRPAPITITADGSVNGVATYNFGDDQYSYGPDPTDLAYSKAANSEVVPFTADIDRYITAVSDGEVSTSFTSPEAHVDLIGNNLRFGRIKMDNVHGSELKKLKIPIVIEYFGASGSFVVNTDDTDCTQVVTSDLNITLTPPTSTSIVSIANTESVGHVVSITAPGNGNNDVVRISPNLDKWLRYRWNNSDEFNEDPKATATFGVFKGHQYIIYMEQSYH